MSTLFSIVATEFDCIGAQISVSAKLISFLASLKSSVVESQKRLMAVVDSVAKKQSKQAE
jgi:hypothetical protein